MCKDYCHIMCMLLSRCCYRKHQLVLLPRTLYMYPSTQTVLMPLSACLCQSQIHHYQMVCENCIFSDETLDNLR